MDVRSTALVRLAPLTASWRERPRDRRAEDAGRGFMGRVASASDTSGLAPHAVSPLGPAAPFMAHVLGQGEIDRVNLAGAGVYAHMRRPRLACGVCADERV